MLNALNDILVTRKPEVRQLLDERDRRPVIHLRHQLLILDLHLLLNVVRPRPPSLLLHGPDHRVLIRERFAEVQAMILVRTGLWDVRNARRGRVVGTLAVGQHLDHVSNRSPAIAKAEACRDTGAQAEDTAHWASRAINLHSFSDQPDGRGNGEAQSLRENLNSLMAYS